MNKNLMLKMVNKKAISPVITTVLLIMISIAAVAIVASFVVPWVQQKMEQRKCFDAMTNIMIDTSSQYTCYRMEKYDPGTPADATDDINYAVLQVSVKRGAEALDIQRFFITAYGGGKSEKFEIIKGDMSSTKKQMYGTTALPGTYTIEVPERREMRTYVLNTSTVNPGPPITVTVLPIIDSAELSPIVGNTPCDAVDKQKIEPC